ncbi:class I mannose-6-phosphate isomerase [Kushneria indalinina]|uniref:Phosphohexomutase n=1 Tax=Kushneria indalinina DSM 14324 TaxID=1122140 RepID=A0A3D9DU57_9GAMM|nr:class I mannose-6-phosphate isomerase [Kushneria indalinina]REC94211.1 mannose-6-phosphate isomerase [Kushneria indalinina DSM 14324]
MRWYPLKLTSFYAPHVFGGRQIEQVLGRRDLPKGRVAESWESSDIEGKGARVTNGELAGQSLHALVEQYPEALVGEGFDGPHFPVLAKFIDATGMLPVHLHANGPTARRKQTWSHGKTEAWHILHAAPGATLLAGVRDGVDHDTLRTALWEERFDEVMHRIEIRPGDTLYVQAGLLHSFGPDTLLYEVQQQADHQQHAMAWQMEDGSEISHEQRETNIDALLEEIDLSLQTAPSTPLSVHEAPGVERRFCCVGPFFALERVAIDTTYTRTIERATLVSNLGAPFTLHANGEAVTLERGESVLLPAALGEATLEGRAEVLMSYVPDLGAVKSFLEHAGFTAEELGRLGDIDGVESL